MSTKPRTPENFPKMKHRAATRPWRKVDSALKRISKTLRAAARAYRRLGKVAFEASKEFQALNEVLVIEDGDCGCDKPESVLDCNHDQRND